MAFSPRGLIFPEGYLSESLPRGNRAVPIAPGGNGAVAVAPGRNGAIAIAPRRNRAVAVAQGRGCRGARDVSRSELNCQRRKYEQ